MLLVFIMKYVHESADTGQLYVFVMLVYLYQHTMESHLRLLIINIAVILHYRQIRFAYPSTISCILIRLL